MHSFFFFFFVQCSSSCTTAKLIHKANTNYQTVFCCWWGMCSTNQKRDSQHFYILIQFKCVFLIGSNGSRSTAWKYANHNNIAIDPQLVRVMKTFKGRHLPDIHNEVLPGRKSGKTQVKRRNWLVENRFSSCLGLFWIPYKKVFQLKTF